MKLQREFQELIQRELALNGINLDETAWLASDAVLAELTNVLTPEVHEGRIATLGAIFVESVGALGKVRCLPLPPEKLELARRLADGARSFLLYEKAQFSGLVFYPEVRANELELIQMVPKSGGLIAQRDSAGVTKFFRQSGIAWHVNRTWFTKPHVKQAARAIAQCVPGINRSVLNRILEFAFHVLSPASRIGATLVWSLRPDTLDADKSLAPFLAGSPLASMGLSILDERDSAAICHLLSQIDGAAFLGPDGELLNAGVHLRSSARTSALIPEFKGTRHTSGQRFSYDHSDTLVIVISEDGPVTIFSDGASLADLRSRTAEEEARLLRRLVPGKGEVVSDREFEVVCAKCRKTSLVQEIGVRGCKQPQSVACPVCTEPLHTATCFRLQCSPYKSPVAR